MFDSTRALRKGADHGRRGSDGYPEAESEAFPGVRPGLASHPVAAEAGRWPRPQRSSQHGRQAQSIRLERGGLILEFGAGCPGNVALGGKAAERPEQGVIRLQWRIRSDGLMAHALVDVASQVMERFCRALDELLTAGEGEAQLSGLGPQASALRIEALDGLYASRMTVLACPGQGGHSRVVIENFDLSPAELQTFRSWASHCC